VRTHFRVCSRAHSTVCPCAYCTAYWALCTLCLCYGGGGQSELRRELEDMRRRAEAESEKARVEAELRAQRALTRGGPVPERSGGPAQAGEQETAVRVEVAAQEAARAMAEAQGGAEGCGAARLRGQRRPCARRQSPRQRWRERLRRGRGEACRGGGGAGGGGGEKVPSAVGKLIASTNYREYSFHDIKVRAIRKHPFCVLPSVYCPSLCCPSVCLCS